MLTTVIREHEYLTQAENLVQVRDFVTGERKIRRVTLYWYSRTQGTYGPNGFTVDRWVGRDLWWVQAVSGVSAANLMPGSQVPEGEVAEEARRLFKAALEEEKHDQEHRRPESDEIGLRTAVPRVRTGR